MKRVNLLEYFELAELLHEAKRVLSSDKLKGGSVWVHTYELPEKLGNFERDDNGFSASKRVAGELVAVIQTWLSENLMDGNSPLSFSTEKFDVEFPGWKLSTITRKIDAFKSVFAAECADVDVYSVGQIAIYKTSDLVSTASKSLPEGTRDSIPFGATIEFDDAGRCLAFGLPTACGFHALRGLELVIEGYLRAFGVTKTLHTWGDYVEEAKKLAEGNADKKPAKKVSQLIDRMRDLDRNPLMHPRDTLDEVGADMLFRLSGIAAYEIVKDMKANGRSMVEPDNEKAPDAIPNANDAELLAGPKKGKAA